MIDFQKVISVRERKANSSKSKEKQLFSNCHVARAMVADAQQEVDEFAESVKGLEIRLLSDLVKKNITVQDVAIVRDKLKDVQQHAKGLVGNVHQRQAELLVQEGLLDDQRRQSAHLSSKLNRITELNNKLAESEAINQLKEEDAKMDEFAETMSARRRL